MKTVPGTYLCAFLMPCRADSLSCGMLLAVAWRNARVRELILSHAALLRGVLFVLFLGVGGLLWWLVHPINAVTVTIGYTWLAFFYSALLLTVVSQSRGCRHALALSRMARWHLLLRLPPPRRLQLFCPRYLPSRRAAALQS